jgi:hypothetical protein
MEVETEPTLQTPLEKRYRHLPYRQSVFVPKKESTKSSIDLETALTQVLTLKEENSTWEGNLP